MPAYLFAPPTGIPGSVSRIANAKIEAQQVDPTNGPAVYGAPVAIDATSHKVRAIAADDTAASVYGFAVRPFPFGGSNVSTFGPPSSGLVDVMRSGYIFVTNKVGTPALNGQVYVRVVAAGGKNLGDVEAQSDSTNNVAVNATFMGAADANGTVEIAFNI